MVPNKFPALQPGPTPPKKLRGIYQWMEGVGVHEVIIETPDHNLEMADLPAEHLAQIIQVYRLRTLSIEEQFHHKYVQIFKIKAKRPEHHYLILIPRSLPLLLFLKELKKKYMGLNACIEIILENALSVG